MEIEVKKRMICWNDQEAYLIIVNDLTSEMREKQALDMEHSSQIMVATASHDLRTPLNSVKNMLGLLKNFVKHPQGNKYITLADNSASLMNQLIKDTLDFFKLRQGKFQLECGPFKLREAAEEVFQLIEFQMKDKGLKKIVHIDHSLEELTVVSDKARIIQVLLNLL